jgi:hypothetical protein
VDGPFILPDALYRESIMDDEKKKCRSCKELIWAEASICPKCRTQQNKPILKTILLTLKELSVVTVILSLIFAVIEFNRFADSWFENSAYADRLAGTASMLLDTGDFSGARTLLSDAQKAHPASSKVGGIQKQLAMISIRENGFPQKPKEVEELKKSLHSLYRSLGKSDTNDADALAHIAWATHLLRDKDYASVDINKYLDKALAIDKSSVYANTYKGYLYMRTIYSNNTLSELEIVNKAQQHFNTALHQSNNSGYVRRLQLSGLNSDSKSYIGKSQYVKLVLAMRATNDAYLENHQEWVYGRIQKYLYEAIAQNAQDNSKTIMENVFFKLNNEEINSIKELLGKNTGAPWFEYMFSAMLNEDKGSYLQALDDYITAYNLVKNTSYGYRYDIPILISRICSAPENKAPELKPKCDNFFENIDPNHFRNSN